MPSLSLWTLPDPKSEAPVLRLHHALFSVQVEVVDATVEESAAQPSKDAQTPTASADEANDRHMQ